MKKKLLVLAVAGAMAAPLTAYAGATVNGYGDINFVITDEFADNSGPGGSNPNENQFSANGEVDISGGSNAVSGRVDIDFLTDTNEDSVVDGNDNQVQIEQAFFNWNMGMASLKGGIFNAPIGYEAEDARDNDYIMGGQVADILNNATSLYGVNVAGAAVSAKLGMLNGTIGLLNDIGGASGENSILLALSADVIPDLNIAFGYITQKCDFSSTDAICTALPTTPGIDPGELGDIYDLNATYKIAGFKVAGEYMSASEVIDHGVGLYATYDFGNNFGVAFRYDDVSYAATGVSSQTSTTLGASYKAADNFKVRGEWYSHDNGSSTHDVIQLQGLVSF